MKSSPKKAKAPPWTIREWGSLSSVVGTLVLLWMTFGPRSANATKQLTDGGN